MSTTGGRHRGWLDLYWIPLGAGGHVVRANGRAYEWGAARRAHWAGGAFPDVADAVDSPVRTSRDPEQVHTALSLVRRHVPLLTWGRDELRDGEMWNSNSLVAWVLARSGHVMREISPPAGGRAPGWGAGLVLAERQGRRTT